MRLTEINRFQLWKSFLPFFFLHFFNWNCYLFGTWTLHRNTHTAQPVGPYMTVWYDSLASLLNVTLLKKKPKHCTVYCTKYKHKHVNTTLKAAIYLEPVQPHGGKVYIQTQKLKTAADQNDARVRNLRNLNRCVVIGRHPVQVRKRTKQTNSFVNQWPWRQGHCLHK